MEGNPGQAATLEEQLKEVQEKLEIAEKRQKDTQAAYTKGQQKLKAVEAEKELLTEKLGSLSFKETEELEELKVTDPDAWYTKRQALESQAKEELAQQLGEVSSKASAEVELARRAQVLEDFNQSHPDIQLTDELIALDVPQRITAQLEKGEVTFEEFLDNAYNYLKSPKKVGRDSKAVNQPDLGKLGGGEVPHKSTTAADIVNSYNNEIY